MLMAWTGLPVLAPTDCVPRDQRSAYEGGQHFIDTAGRSGDHVYACRVEVADGPSTDASHDYRIHLVLNEELRQPSAGVLRRRLDDGTGFDRTVIYIGQDESFRLPVM